MLTHSLLIRPVKNKAPAPNAQRVVAGSSTAPVPVGADDNVVSGSHLAETPTRFLSLPRFYHSSTTLPLSIMIIRPKPAHSFFSTSIIHNCPSPPLTVVQDDGDDDVCASCGLGGLIIGCDHCNDWYHFACAEPPIPEGADAPDDFVCHQCRRLFVAAEAASATVTKSALFSTLSAALPRPEAGPNWFELPQEIRDHFESVTTQPDGAYGDAPAREINL